MMKTILLSLLIATSQAQTYCELILILCSCVVCVVCVVCVY